MAVIPKMAVVLFFWLLCSPGFSLMQDVSPIKALRLKAEEDAVAGKNQIYFLHMHKAGGTTICELARKQRHRTPGANCLPKGSGPRNWIPLGSYSETKLTRWARTNKHTFFANEFSPVRTLLPPGPFLYVTCLRDPMNRALSHFKYVKIWWRNFLMGQRTHFQGGRAPSRTFPWKSFAAFLADESRDEKQTGEVENLPSKKHSIYPNNFGYKNFQVHMLTACQNACDESSLELAKKRLDYFSVIVILEQWKESAELFTRKLGWKGAANFKAKQHQNTHSNAAKELRNHPKLLQLLRESNHLDMELYAHGITLMEALLQEPPTNMSVRRDSMQSVAAAPRALLEWSLLLFLWPLWAA